MFRRLSLRKLLPIAIVLTLCLWAFLVVTQAGAVNAATTTWRWPLAGHPEVVRGFDPPPVPWAAGHRGVDLRAPVGATVYAAGAGVVGYAGLLAGRGVVALHHAEGLETTYEPVVVLVRAGQHVAAGAPIGQLQGGHGDCGPRFACLHWGLRRGDTYLDPLQLVQSGPIRLLPIWSDGFDAVARTDGVDIQAAPPGLGPPAGPGGAPSKSHHQAAAGAAALAAVSVVPALAVRRRRQQARLPPRS